MRDEAGRFCRDRPFNSRIQRGILLPGRCAEKALGTGASIAFDARVGSAGSNQWLVFGDIGHDRQCVVGEQFHSCRISALSAADPLGLAEHIVLAQAHAIGPSFDVIQILLSPGGRLAAGHFFVLGTRSVTRQLLLLIPWSGRRGWVGGAAWVPCQNRLSLPLSLA